MAKQIYSEDIHIDAEEMHEVMRMMTSLEVSFRKVLLPYVNTIQNTPYYEGGDASEVVKKYKEAVNKIGEITELYERASAAVSMVFSQWLEQDEILAANFYASLTEDSQLTKNIVTLSEGEQK